MIYPLFALGTSEILIIVLIIVLLFGAKKIPELMRGMGRGVKEFKDAVDGKESTDEVTEKENEPEK
jgi:sec-independent protein translocase protein TatA